MASSTLYSAVRTWMDANWSACPVAWENETFEKPKPTDDPDSPATWIEVEFTGGLTEQTTIGTGSPTTERWVEDGSVIFRCFVQTGAGSLAARTHATNLAEQLKGLELPGTIRFRSLSIGDGAAGTEDGNWWGLPLYADWVRG